MESEFNLFRYSLLKFDEENKDGPLTVFNPLSVKLSFFFDGIENVNEVQEKIQFMIQIIEKKGGAKFSNVYLMYSVILTIDELFKYYINNSSDYITAAEQLIVDEENRNNKNYWLLNWGPEEILRNKNNLKEQFEGAFESWKRNTDKLRSSLFNIISLPPFTFDGSDWSVLTNDKS